MIKPLLDSLDVNKSFLEKPDSIWVITTAKNQEMLDAISKGLSRTDDAVVLIGQTSPDGKASPVLIALSTLTGAVIVHHDVEIDPNITLTEEYVSKHKESLKDLNIFREDTFPSFNIHIDMDEVERINNEINQGICLMKEEGMSLNIRRGYEEPLVETLANMISDDETLIPRLRGVFMHPNISVKELKQKIERNKDCLESLLKDY